MTDSTPATKESGLLSRVSIPGWAADLIGFAIAVADWTGRLDAWTSLAQGAGGVVSVVASLLTSPGLPVALILMGSGYLWIISDPESKEKSWLPSTAWIVLLLLTIPFISMSLFIEFIHSSNIPEMAQTIADANTPRILTSNQRGRLYVALHHLVGKVPTIELATARVPESLQFAGYIFDVFKETGLAMENEERAIPVDLDSLSAKGILISVKNTPRLRDAAASLRDAFVNANINHVQVMLTNALPDGTLQILVGYK